MTARSLCRHRARAFMQQRGRCYYCGLPIWQRHVDAFAAAHGLTQRQAKRFQCTAEHLVPRSNGGRDARDNIVAACVDCNRTRHRRKNPPTPNVWRARRRARAERLRRPLH